MRRRGLLVAALVAALGVAAWSERGTLRTGWRLASRFDEDAPCPRCSVLLVSVDTLRADHLGCLGYERDTSPRLCRFFQRGQRWTRALSQSAWTAPAHASMFTGLLPGHHGVRTGPVIPALRGHPTIFSIFEGAGYRTTALHGGGYLSPVLDREHIGTERRVTLRDDLLDVVARGLQPGPLGQPGLVFLHGYDVHTPYTPERNRFLSPDPALDAVAARDGYCAYADAADGSRVLDPATVPGDPDVQAYLASLYDSEIAEVDASLGALLEGLDASGRLDHTVVMLTADHGEEFWEHGGCDHVRTVHTELLHVPVFLAWPGSPQGDRTDVVAASISVLPTLLDVVGLSAAGLSFDGTSLRSPPAAEVLGEARFHYDGALLRRSTVAVDPLKLVVDLNTGEQLLFDISEDWAEQRPLADSGERSAALRAVLDRYEHGSHSLEATSGMLDDRTRQELQSLGYLP